MRPARPRPSSRGSTSSRLRRRRGPCRSSRSSSRSRSRSPARPPTAGADPAVGEKALNELYQAMESGPAWNETLFVITFDEHGGIFDHVPPPKAENPWPNDVIDGFGFDMMGVRVPTILVSPLIKRQTVFRSPTATAYNSTSFLATLLNWYGVPRARWGLGERARHAPTFEGVLQLADPRVDEPAFESPAIGETPSKPRVSDLDRLMAPRIAAALSAGRRSPSDMAANLERADGVVRHGRAARRASPARRKASLTGRGDSRGFGGRRRSRQSPNPVSRRNSACRRRPATSAWSPRSACRGLPPARSSGSAGSLSRRPSRDPSARGR